MSLRLLFGVVCTLVFSCAVLMAQPVVAQEAQDSAEVETQAETAPEATTEEVQATQQPTDQMMKTTGGLDFRSGTVVLVNEPVQRDLYVAGSSVQIESDVQGDVFAVAQDVTINGIVRGDVRVAGSSVTINGTIEGNVIAFGSTVKIGDSARIQGHLNAYGATVVAGGAVTQSTAIGGTAVALNGSFTGPVEVKADSVQVGQAAVLSAPVHVQASQEPSITNEQQRAQVTYTYYDPAAATQDTRSTAERFWDGVQSAAYWYVALAILGILFIVLWGTRMRSTIESIEHHVGTVALKGIIVFFLTPIVALLIAITIVGIPLALLLLMAYVIVILLADVVVSAWIGQKLLPGQNQEGVRGLIVQYLVGFLILALLSATPYIGWIINLLAMIFGIGAVFQAMMRYYSGKKQNADSEVM